MVSKVKFDYACDYHRYRGPGCCPHCFRKEMREAMARILMMLEGMEDVIYLAKAIKMQEEEDAG